MTDLLLSRLEGLPAYRIERELGGGGMSRVFLAEETALGRRVAIKVLETQGASVDAERFRQEVLLSARLQHPHIVPLLTAGQLDQTPYYIMPFVEGESLRARMRGGELMPIGEAIRLLRNVAAALSHAHARGIVHRDIKPDNVIITGGLAVVVDFGVSKALAASTMVPRDGNITSAGLTIGTPKYMSPEQALGDPDVDARADLYSWGILAYEMLTGNTPFAGTDPVRQLRAHLTEDPPPITGARAGIPPLISRLVMRCLEKDRTKRPESANEILDQLESLATPASLRAIPLREAAKGWAVPVLMPLGVYVAAVGVMLAGLQWLAQQGQVGTRLFMFSVIIALIGLPVVVAAGMVMRIRGLEAGRWH